ncbi:MAG TPA: rubrerythrin family protein [Candidatus Ornithoclostridium excrementipullorum]|nr:rubrerythrin family protein [Candidatus Ornithoclostridium excrementipullorum]
MQLKDSQTYKNLARAYAGECMAKARYMFIEYGARKEGFKCLAELVDKVVYNEFNHARMFYSFIQTADKKPIEEIEIKADYPFKEKWDLLDNLRFAAEDEAREAEEIYPEFARTARKEGFDDIAGLFENVVQVENCHKMLFTDLYTQMKDGTMYKKPAPVKWKCADCGYEATSAEAWQVCPLCQAKQGAVMLKLSDGQ